jgi:glutaredoxin 2
MQLEEKILDLILSSDQETSDLGYNLLTNKLDNSNVIYWYYKISNLVKNQTLKFTDSIKARKLKEKLKTLSGLSFTETNNAEAARFIKENIDEISNDSINAYFTKLNNAVFWDLNTNTNRTLEEIKEFKKTINALNEYEKPTK